MSKLNAHRRLGDYDDGSQRNEPDADGEVRMRRRPLSRSRRVLYSANCHCSNCRAATGSAFKSFAGIERDKLEVIEGADALLVWGDDDENHTRCAICGSLLYSVVRDGAYVHVAMGSLVEAPSIRPAEHIFVGSMAPWFEITDDLPQAQGYE